MALVLKKLYHAYFWVFNDMSDSRTDEMLMVSSPLMPFSIVLGYLYFIYVLGPKLMENRKPFKIKTLMRMYNILQVLLNAYVMFKSLRRLTVISWECSLVDYSNSPGALEELEVGYIYFLLKIFDLVDTVIFVLRKSYRQITFLHTYHHSGMVIGIWIAVRFFSGGNGVWVTTINCFVHLVMFSYYFLSTFDDKWKKNVTLKRTLTQLQLIQFATFIYIFGRIFFQPNCSYPKIVSYVFVPQNAFMILLFGDFYLKTYVFNKKNAVKRT